MRCAQGPYFTEVKGCPASPKNIGEMIRKHRLDLGLRQVDVAIVIGCDQATIVNWKHGHRAPRINYLSGVVKFLGFDPFTSGDTMAQRLVNRRKALGTQAAFAALVGVDPSTLARWERGDREPAVRFAARVERVLLTRSA